MTASPELIRQLAPTGRLRAALNFGNPVLVQRRPDGSPAGVTVALAHELARRLALELDFVPFDGAGKVVDAAGQWDACFLAIDPVRAAGIAFTSPYVVIEGSYLVPRDAPFRHVDELDHAGARIAVGKGAAYDLYLTRALKHAELVRADSSAAAIDLFLAGGLTAAAGVRQPLEATARADTRYRVVDGRFTQILQAMGTPKDRPEVLAYLQSFIEEMKASGFVAAELAGSGQQDAAVAPPA